MAKLIVLAFAFAALVALASAHRTIVTTTVGEDDNLFPKVPKGQCQQVKQQRFKQCQQFLSQMSSFGGNPSRQQQQPGIQQCCQELKGVEEQCQCKAVKQVFKQALEEQQQQQQQQGGSFGSHELQQLKERVQNLPSQCDLQTKQCQIRTIVTTTTIEDDAFDMDFPLGPQQCRQKIQQQSFNKCQRYMTQQSGSYDPLLMTVDAIPRKKSQDVQQCCDELQYMDEECKCEAVKEVFRQAKQQQQGQQKTGRQGEQQQMRQLREKAEDLPRQCKFQTQQCRIPSEWF